MVIMLKILNLCQKADTPTETNNSLHSSEEVFNERLQLNKAT